MPIEFAMKYTINFLRIPISVDFNPHNVDRKQGQFPYSTSFQANGGQA